jgi:ankyrin repeat protein
MGMLTRRGLSVPAQAKDEQGWTALHIACYFGHQKVRGRARA